MISVLGGSFDPIHRGHLKIAETVYALMEEGTVWFLPCHFHPFEKKLSPVKDRLNMLKIALRAHPHFKIDSTELKAEKISYTLNTLQLLRKRLNKKESLIWIIGSDVLPSLPNWHNWKDLLNYCHFLIAPRKGPPVMDMDLKNYLDRHQRLDFSELRNDSHGLIYFLKMEPIEGSASAIRKAIQEKKTSIPFLDPEVENYILLHQLYPPL